MSLFAKIRAALEQNDACTISKQGAPHYVAMRWKHYQQLMHKIQEFHQLSEDVRQESAEDELYDIDINNIPV